MLLEGAATGRPLITSRIHGCMEAVIENKSGYLCTVKDIDSLYMAMKRVLALPREEKIAMGLCGRRHMEETFEKSKVVRATIDALQLP